MIVFVLWRRRRRRRADAGSGPPARPRPWLPGVRSHTGLVAAREIRERLRARAFRVVTVLILLVVAGAVVIPVVTRGTPAPQRLGEVGPLSAEQAATVRAAASSVGASIEVVPVPDRPRARADLRSGTIDLAVIGGDEVLVKEAPSSSDTSTLARLTRVLAADLGLDNAFAAAGISPAQAAGIRGARPVPVTAVQATARKNSVARGTALVGSIVVFIMLSQYMTWTLIGVMEEKSSRVVEVLLAAVRPLQLLGGKVLGIGIVALGQALLILAFAFGLGEAVGSSLLHGTAPLILLSALVWLIVGYGFYCWVYAAAGSLAERQDQVQTLALPLSLPMILGYVLALTAASSGHASGVDVVFGYLPPTAPFLMPVLVGLQAVTWWQFLMAVVISLGTTVGVARVAALVYYRAVLRTGRRVRLGEVLPFGRGSGRGIGDAA